jgi:N-acetylglutamate synthase
MDDGNRNALATEVTRSIMHTFESLFALAPAGEMWRGAHDTRWLVSGLPAAFMNTVFAPGGLLDAEEVERFAALMDGRSLPWSVNVLGEPAPEIVDLVTRYGLTTREHAPLMVRDSAEPLPPSAGAHPIRTIDGKDHQVYGETLAAGFEAPLEIMSWFARRELLDAPWATAYLLEEEGRPVTTGYATRHGDLLGVWNISTSPEYRRRGYGKVMTEALVRDGFASGARFAYLQASAQGVGVYTSIGFRTVAAWTTFTRD